MRNDRRLLSGRGLAAVLLSLAPAALWAQPAPPPTAGPAAAAADTNPTGWTAKAGVSFVQTGGNSGASTLGLSLNAVRNWTKTYFTLRGGGVRSDTTTKSAYGVGSEDDFDVVEQDLTQKTAENYFLDASLDRNVTKRLFWQTGAGWLRNTFSGVDSRIQARAGAGTIWTDPASKGPQFKTAAFLTLTHQSEVVENPDTSDTFAGARFMADLNVPFGASTFTSRLNLDENLQETKDFLMTWWSSLGVSMNQRLSLQVSLELLYDNLPALRSIPIFLDRSRGAPLGTGLVPAGKWDRQFAVSLVVNLAPKKPVPPPPPPPPCAPCK